jgi:hypothetical protein
LLSFHRFVLAKEIETRAKVEVLIGHLNPLAQITNPVNFESKPSRMANPGL